MRVFVTLQTQNQEYATIYEPPSWTEFHQQTEKERDNYYYCMIIQDGQSERERGEKEEEKTETKTSQPHPLFQPRSVKPTAKRLPRVCYLISRGFFFTRFLPQGFPHSLRAPTKIFTRHLRTQVFVGRFQGGRLRFNPHTECLI